MILGGVKSNALPELASAVVNHRIKTERWDCLRIVYTSILKRLSQSSVSALQESITKKLLPLAEKYNLTLSSFSQVNLTTGGTGTLTLSDAWGTALDPAPVTPTEGDEAGAYRLLSGVIRKTRGKKVTAVSPAIMSGNTG